MVEPPSRSNSVGPNGLAGVTPQLSRLRPALIGGIVGGAVAVFLPAALIFLWAWLSGQELNLGGTGHGNVPRPMSLRAAEEALAIVALVLLFLGLPLLALGSIIGAIIGVKKARKRHPDADA